MAAVFVYAMCVYVSHTYYYSPAGFAGLTPRAKTVEIEYSERAW